MTRKAPALKRLHGGRVLLLLLLAFLLYLFSLVVRIHLAGKHDELGKAAVIIVLGAAQLNGRPSPVLRERLEHAMTLYQSGMSDKLLFTGGKRGDDRFTEAGVGSTFAQKRGVPATAILLEDQGRTTMQSLQRCREIMRREHLQSAILVSDPFHSFRLRRMANDLGIRVLISPTPTSRVRSPLVKLRFELREVATYTLYRFFGI